MTRTRAAALAALLLGACSEPPPPPAGEPAGPLPRPEATSLLGEPLYARLARSR